MLNLEFEGEVNSMRKLALMSIVLVTWFGVLEAQAQGCQGPYGPTQGTMWRWYNLTPGYWYTVTVTNFDPWHRGWVYVEVWDYCWRDVSGKWWCNGFVRKEGPATGWAWISFQARDSEYFIWVVATSYYSICFR